MQAKMKNRSSKRGVSFALLKDFNKALRVSTTA
jgi:hypothetical protein